jgi:hypothetical protein
MPLERSIYAWMYDDSGSSWGHRHTILWYPYNDNSGPLNEEGFLGIGQANGGPYQGPFSSSWNYAEIIVMNVFDPCSAWNYDSSPETPTSISYPFYDSDGSFSVNWSDVAEATEYELQRSAANASFSGAETVYTGPLTSYEESGLNNGFYYYRVRAEDAFGTSDWLTGYSIRIGIPPLTWIPLLLIDHYPN